MRIFQDNRFTTGLVLCFIFLPVSITVSVLYRNSTFDLTRNAQNASAFTSSGLSNNFSGLVISPNGAQDSRIDPGLDSRNEDVHSRIDKTSGSENISNQRSCLSRYESILYRKTSPHKPSPYFLSKLRKYEHHHKRCAPNTRSYNQSIRRLKTRHKTSSATCKYVVWLPANGLGNRMISMASTFLYALLTNRVLLVDHGTDMSDLFCEPFPDTSWLLPRDFPLKNHLKARYAQSFGTIVKHGIINTSTSSSPSYLYANLDHSKYDLDKNLFYCEKTETLLQNVTWLMFLSDQYFAPYFFVTRFYGDEVTKMFPDKDSIFHQLSSYLFNPTNRVWNMITRFYDAYLAKADQRVGLQVRIFNPVKNPFQTVLDQLLNCTFIEKLLPEPGRRESNQSENKTSKAILVTSLQYEVYEKLSNMNWTRSEVVGVYQPSHEEFQQFGNNVHNMKAWSEIYLLSLTDVLVTSSRSTFGYVAQGLGGLKPWILMKTNGKNIRNPPCRRDLSVEPCFHFPPSFDCDARVKVSSGAVLPYLKNCLDFKKGVKLFSHHDERSETNPVELGAESLGGTLYHVDKKEDKCVTIVELGAESLATKYRELSDKNRSSEG
ncbi:galactoside 2-alpha-L-fucosyltransferase-like [Euphorbia lathyris]|uniref:galactoside 2-alpha-L-fucosyltransferase-like n=1 Tax=Euphorbia lathyris TaxID=212925 RepID=UPI0033141E00